MDSLKDVPLDPDMQNLYNYYTSQCGLGPYPPTPTHVRVSGLGNQVGSSDKGMTVIPNYQRKNDAYKIPTVIQSPTEAALARAKQEYKREQKKTESLDFSKPKPKKKKTAVKKHAAKKSADKKKKPKRKKSNSKKFVGKKKTVPRKNRKRKSVAKRKSNSQNNLNFRDIFSG